jgi:hypothetical protein
MLGRSEWSHNPEHRLGVPYANPRVASRFAGNGVVRGEAGGFARGQQGSRAEFPAQQRFGNPGFEQRG